MNRPTFCPEFLERALTHIWGHETFVNGYRIHGNGRTYVAEDHSGHRVRLKLSTPISDVFYVEDADTELALLCLEDAQQSADYREEQGRAWAASRGVL